MCLLFQSEYLLLWRRNHTEVTAWCPSMSLLPTSWTENLLVCWDLMVNFVGWMASCFDAVKTHRFEKSIQSDSETLWWTVQTDYCLFGMNSSWTDSHLPNMHRGLASLCDKTDCSVGKMMAMTDGTGNSGRFERRNSGSSM